ncbi:M15 family metallopeptidase [Nocardia sp. NPDC127526]|uniref:M15 family metallopeptidase n=1 Tax=Nocardia sp. NPDC127526 TaxID=3345393 RepID=UPI0036359EAB
MRRSAAVALLAGLAGSVAPVAHGAPGEPALAPVMPPLVLRQAAATDAEAENTQAAAVLLGLPPTLGAARDDSRAYVAVAGSAEAGAPAGTTRLLPGVVIASIGAKTAREDLSLVLWGQPAVPVVEATLPVATAIAAGTEGLDPRLASAFTEAEKAAAVEGVTVWITSGHRTYGEQQWLWEDGIARYGSPEAARQWVLPPEESTHVSGEAIDVGPREGAQWLEDNGYRWGLCRTYDNEWWHFELDTVPGVACPARLPDASAR